MTAIKRSVRAFALLLAMLMVLNGSIVALNRSATFDPEAPEAPFDFSEGDDASTGDPEELDFPFADVQEERWFRTYVEYVYECGLMNGNSATEFMPTELTTRAMVVTVLYRIAGSPEAGKADFQDVDHHRWYAHAVAWAVENGITLGYGDGTFGPDDPVTREQLVAFLYRFVGYLGGETTQRSNLNLFSDRNKIAKYAEPCVRWAVSVGVLSGRTETKLEPKGEATRAELAAFLYKLECYVLDREQVFHPESVNVPILIFHSVTQETENTASVTVDQFHSVMEMLREGGYETVTYGQLIQYVENGEMLPERPVIISLDDGYRDNLENAYPILQEYGFCCEIHVIGCYVGQSQYDGDQLIPHFSLDEVLALEPGIVNIQSHTMRMHMTADREDLSQGRRGVARRATETKEAYRAALRQDFGESYELISEVLENPVALAYPYGIFNAEADKIAEEQGYQVTVTIRTGGNVITVGNWDSLRLLNRVSVDGETTLEEFENMIQVR